MFEGFDVNDASPPKTLGTFFIFFFFNNLLPAIKKNSKCIAVFVHYLCIFYTESVVLSSLFNRQGLPTIISKI